ncbi:MAG: sigma-70 family RNA polymerase sigma factor [Bacteroidota bacterium]
MSLFLNEDSAPLNLLCIPDRNMEASAIFVTLVLLKSLSNFMKQPDDLIRKMQAGDHQAFSRLYDLYSRAIYGVILPIVRDTEIAEEVLQDVFVKAWNHASAYSTEKGRFYTWLLNIARNKSIDVTRSKAFRNSSKNLTTEKFVDTMEGQENFDRKTDSIGVKNLLAALQPLCIELLELLYFRGYTQAETAEELDTPLGTIKTRARKCIGELRKMIENEQA